jgi:hypothetical protein
MTVMNLKLYNLLKNDLHLPDGKAEEFVQVMDDLIQGDKEKSAAEYKSLFKEDLSKLELKVSDLRVEIKETKVDTIKWMVGLFFALALMIIGLYIKK